MPRGSLSLGHADGPLCDACHSSFHPDGNSHSFHSDVSHPEFCPANVLPYPDVSQPQSCPADIPLSSDISQPQFCSADISLSPDISQRNSIRPTFHLLWIFRIWRLWSDGRGGRFNFPGLTCPNPLVAPTRKTSESDNSDSPGSLARQTLAIHRIHFHP